MKTQERGAYITGLLTGSALFLLLFLFIGYRIGFSKIIDHVFPQKDYRALVDIPDAVLAEMQEKKMVVGNARNPTQTPPHSSFTVKEDAQLGYVLQPNIKVMANVLRSVRPFNFNLPVLFWESNTEISEVISRYLADHSLLTYTYTTDDNGFRKTVPTVDAARKVLVIGDSVPFGDGVDDEHTMISYLQSLVGFQVQIVNAAVGGYDGRQAVAMARRQMTLDAYDGLIYVASQNDFMIAEDWTSEAHAVLEELHALSEQFGGNIIVLLVPYMEYSLFPFFLEEYWAQTAPLLQNVADISSAWGFIYYDWMDVFNAFQEEHKSVFAGFALYVDHSHLSPLGNKLAAEKLYHGLRELEVVAHVE